MLEDMQREAMWGLLNLMYLNNFPIMILLMTHYDLWLPFFKTKEKIV
ncbi:hypothetical protein H8E88_32575 [candidate division KSB1 bacterium]|nr:hypothetical protein [candidate division KSB1 bacterium]MBL7093564.1 hypothetical protein [candidate division KSB1 bacterium]